MKFLVKQNKKNEFRFLLKAQNGETIAQSENYKNKKDCLSTIELVKACADAEIVFPIKVGKQPKKES